MQLTVKFITGEAVTLNVTPTMTVAQVKAEIERKTDVPSNQQQLMVQNGQPVEMRDNQQLQNYSIPNDTIMIVVKKEEPMMNVFLKNDKGRTSTYAILPTQSVLDFKRKVQQLEQVPVDQQRLIYEGSQLENGKKLGDYNIRPETTMFLNLRLRGGNPLQASVFILQLWT
ncbi:polyubiquitin-like [Protopterus annectens]|uniref:polyubiquitin-like n=1 Tax=Protopterus annectens TaxID=7888 RepID=UPI001CFA2789|nr:polyubiquitin-like [Protopterus annectens]